MEESRIQKYSQKMNQELNNSYLRIQQEDQVALHCRKDHKISSPLDSRVNKSSYHSTYSPSKHPNYNQPELAKELERLRRNQNSLSILPSIQENSSYKRSFHGDSGDVINRGKEKPSFFLKMKWPNEPTSVYQKDYKSRESSLYNSINKDRPQNDNLHVLNLKENKRTSLYREEYQPKAIKREAVDSLKDKDHLRTKENYDNETHISEYKRKYDSILGLTKKDRSSLLKL